MEDLNLIPTSELIKELMRRNTFAGLILFSPENHKFDGQIHEDFRLLTTACEEDTIRLLENALETVRNQTQ